MAGDFNLFFNSKLEAQGGNPTLKKKCLVKLIEFKETYDLCDIWRVRNTKSKRFTFTLKHSSGFIQRRLDYILILNTLQEFVTMADILTPISADHSPLLLSLSKGKITIRGRGLWKFNSSLPKDESYKTGWLVIQSEPPFHDFRGSGFSWLFLDYSSILVDL